MRTKRIDITFRQRKTNEDLIDSFLEEYRDGVEDLIILEPEDEDIGKVKVSYSDGEREVADFIYDMELCEGITQYRMKVMEEEMGIYLCYATINDIEYEENKMHISLTVEMPWDAETSVPTVPENEQHYIPVHGEKEHTSTLIKGVGAKYHISEAQYHELYERMREQETINVTLKKEPDNPKDKKAIAIYDSIQGKIGYVATEYLTLVHILMAECDEKEAELTFIEYPEGIIVLRIKTEIDHPIEVLRLFTQYSPLEVYRAWYLYKRAGGIMEREEAELFDKSEQKIHFDKFAELSIAEQNQLAVAWLYRMKHGSVANPNNPRGRMSVPLDLSLYDTSWKELDLSNSNLLDLIEIENKMVAIYISMRRKGYPGTPEDFKNEIADGEMEDRMLKRLQEVYESKRL